MLQRGLWLGLQGFGQGLLSSNLADRISLASLYEMNACS